MKQRTLGFCPIGNGSDIGPFRDVFAQKRSMDNSPDRLVGVDAVVFWGGTDIHPSIYGQSRHPFNQASKNMSERDAFELALMTECKQKGVPMIGVCRGAQLMCAFEGGTLVQHVNGHSGDHAIQVEVFPNKFEIMETTSAHHQMMNPRDTNHKVLGTTWGPTHRSQVYQGESHLDPVECMHDQPEPEIVYFPDCKGLAIQGHPEWVAAHHPFAVVCNTLIRQYLLEEEHEGLSSTPEGQSA